MDKVVSCKQYTSNITAEVWQEARPYIDEAAKYSHWEFVSEDVLESLHDNKQQLWLVYEDETLKFVWVTEILQQSGRKVVIVISAGGEMEYGWKFWPWMSQWMLGNGIDEAEVFCRPSVSRLLQRYGLKVKYEVLSIKPLRKEHE